MDKIAILPLFVSAYLLLQKNSKEVFILFFLPLLTVVPTYYEVKIISGLPEVNFYIAGMLPILLVWLFKEKAISYRFSLLDSFIFLNLLTLFISQYYTSSYKVAQKFIFNESMARLFPYLLMKTYFAEREERQKVIRIIIILGAIVGLLNLWEFRIWDNFFDKYIRKIWPYYVPWDLPMKRGGFKRAFGPFGHPIIAGYFFALVLPIGIWYWRKKLFTKKWHGPLVIALLFAGGIASISRAPIAAMFIGLIILWFGWTRRKVFVLSLILLGAIVFSSVYLPKIIGYVSINRSMAETADQRNAAYRMELLENYIQIVNQKPVLGWGRFSVPWVDNQVSIDNEYLFLALTHGKLNLFMYLSTIIVCLFRLTIFIWKEKQNSQEKEIAWCFVAAILSGTITQTTVWNGFQIVPYFYMFLAMSEAIVIYRPNPNREVSQSLAIELMPQSHAYHFSRTL
ncbi:MAG: O-antigen ligase family protein [Spirochaetota bacterium]